VILASFKPARFTMEDIMEVLIIWCSIKL